MKPSSCPAGIAPRRGIVADPSGTVKVPDLHVTVAAAMAGLSEVAESRSVTVVPVLAAATVHDE